VGVISGQFNKRATERLLAPVRGAAQLSEADVFAMLQRLVEGYTPETGFLAITAKRTHGFWLRIEADGNRTVICAEPQVGKHAGTGYRGWHWQARVWVLPSSDQPNGSVVALQLARWRTKDKKLLRANLFEEFRDHFVAALQTADPTFALLPPV
jgi:hypothetical protein